MTRWLLIRWWKKYVEIAKLFRDEGYEAQAGQWQEGWFAGMNDSLVDAEGNAKQVFSYFLPTWGLPYVLGTQRCLRRWFQRHQW